MQQIDKQKLKLLFLTLFLTLSTIIVVAIHHFNEVSHKEYLKNVTSRYVKAYKSAYFEKKELSRVLISGLMRMGKVPQLLSQIKNNPNKKNQAREEMYKALNVRYKELTNMGVDQLHIHLPNNESFLRMHKPKVYGDNLTTIRPTVAYVNKYLKPIDSMEEGRIYFGLRFVYPVFYNNEHVGSIEISYSVSSVVDSIMTQYDVLSNFFINKDVANEKNFINSAYVKSMYDGFYYDKRVLKIIREKMKRE